MVMVGRGGWRWVRGWRAWEKRGWSSWWGQPEVGKSTLINAIYNHILGVTWEDDFRFKLVDESGSTPPSQSVSETQRITAYTLHHQRGCFLTPHTLTLIDTPGLGSTQGLARDREILQQMQSLVSGEGATRRIHAVALVTESSTIRLTSSQTYILHAIQSLVGRDSPQNIFLLVTFADTNKPPILNAMKSANFQYNKHYTFNCAALYNERVTSMGSESSDIDRPDNKDGDDEDALNKRLWRKGAKETLSFIQQIGTLKPLSVSHSETDVANGNTPSTLTNAESGNQSITTKTGNGNQSYVTNYEGSGNQSSTTSNTGSGNQSCTTTNTESKSTKPLLNYLEKMRSKSLDDNENPESRAKRFLFQKPKVPEKKFFSR